MQEVARNNFHLEDFEPRGDDFPLFISPEAWIFHTKRLSQKRVYANLIMSFLCGVLSTLSFVLILKVI